jgi:hypothetical protein
LSLNRSPSAIAALAVCLAVPAAADDGVLHDLAGQVRTRLEDASRERLPKPVPPVPVAIRWRADKVDSLDLGAPLVALTAADLDHDGKGELYAVTPREVVAIGVTGKRARELARFPFVGEPASVQPRDVVGAAHAEGDTVVAGASGFTRGLVIRWNGKALVADPGEAAFALCPGVQAQLVPGRNYFSDQTYMTRCRDLVDAAGNPLRVRATLSMASKLDVAVTPCALDGACQAAKSFEIANAGVAYEIADVDRDGSPEIIYSAATAPGDADTVRVMKVGGAVAFTKAFKAGAVAGIAVVDLDGNHKDDVIVALRIVGARAVDLWRLD